MSPRWLTSLLASVSLFPWTSRMLQRQINSKTLKRASKATVQEGAFEKSRQWATLPESESIRSYKGDAWANQGWPPWIQQWWVLKEKGPCRMLTADLASKGNGFFIRIVIPLTIYIGIKANEDNRTCLTDAAAPPMWLTLKHLWLMQETSALKAEDKVSVRRGFIKSLPGALERRLLFKLVQYKDAERSLSMR